MDSHILSMEASWCPKYKSTNNFMKTTTLMLPRDYSVWLPMNRWDIFLKSNREKGKNTLKRWPKDRAALTVMSIFVRNNRRRKRCLITLMTGCWWEKEVYHLDLFSHFKNCFSYHYKIPFQIIRHCLWRIL